MKYKVRIQYTLKGKLKSDTKELNIQGAIVMNSDDLMIVLWNESKKHLVEKYTGKENLQDIKLVNVVLLK